jgi:hypothetical protein
MTFAPCAVKLKKNQVFASVVDWVLSETQVRFRGFATLVPLSG